MNDYLTMKMIDTKHQDVARRQRNADHLAALNLPRVSLWARIARRLPQPRPSSALAAEAARLRLQKPPCVPARTKLTIEQGC